MNLTMTISEKDKRLLYVVSMVAFVVLFLRFVFFPALSADEQARADLEEARAAQQEMDFQIMLAPTAALDVQNAYTALMDSSALFYATLKSDELDTLITSLELSHGLEPISLQIGVPTINALSGYSAGPLAGSTASAPDLTEAMSNIGVPNLPGEEGEVATGSLILPYVAPAMLIEPVEYLKVATVVLSCSGPESNFYAMLDTLEASYPSVLLKQFEISPRTTATAGGTSETTLELGATLDIYLCDKEGVYQ